MSQRTVLPVSESTPLSLEQLTPDQRTCLRQVQGAVAAVLAECAEAPSEGRQEGLATPSLHRSARVMMIEGERGTGKTAVMLTILRRWSDVHRTSRREWDPNTERSTLKPGPDAEKSEGWFDARLAQSVWPLPMLDFDPMPQRLPLVAWVLQSFMPLVRLATQASAGSSLAHRHADQANRRSLLETWTRLIEEAVEAWDSGEPAGRTFLERTEGERSRLRSWERFVERYTTAVDGLVAKMPTVGHNVEENMVFVLPIDDVDMQVARAAELSHTLRLLRHDRVIFLTTGHRAHLVEVTRVQALGAYRRLSEQAEHSELPNDWRALGASIVQKVFPVGLTFRIPTFSLFRALERLEKWPSAKDADQAKGWREVSGELAKKATVPMIDNSKWSLTFRDLRDIAAELDRKNEQSDPVDNIVIALLTKAKLPLVSVHDRISWFLTGDSVIQEMAHKLLSGQDKVNLKVVGTVELTPNLRMAASVKADIPESPETIGWWDFLDWWMTSRPVASQKPLFNAVVGDGLAIIEGTCPALRSEVGEKIWWPWPLRYLLPSDSSNSRAIERLVKSITSDDGTKADFETILCDVWINLVSAKIASTVWKNPVTHDSGLSILIAGASIAPIHPLLGLSTSRRQWLLSRIISQASHDSVFAEALSLISTTKWSSQAQHITNEVLPEGRLFEWSLMQNQSVTADPWIQAMAFVQGKAAGWAFFRMGTALSPFTSTISPYPTGGSNKPSFSSFFFSLGSGSPPTVRYHNAALRIGLAATGTSEIARHVSELIWKQTNTTAATFIHEVVKTILTYSSSIKVTIDFTTVADGNRLQWPKNTRYSLRWGQSLAGLGPQIGWILSTKADGGEKQETESYGLPELVGIAADLVQTHENNFEGLSIEVEDIQIDSNLTVKIPQSTSFLRTDRLLEWIPLLANPFGASSPKPKPNLSQSTLLARFALLCCHCMTEPISKLSNPPNFDQHLSVILKLMSGGAEPDTVSVEHFSAWKNWAYSELGKHLPPDILEPIQSWNAPEPTPPVS
jgi:hypothetical protein